MKPFNLGNYDRLNLECVIAGKTYSDEDFELGSLSSSDKSSATITLQGRLEDFELFKNASTVLLNIITASNTIPYMELFVKHPISFNGTAITATLDTAPRAKNVSYTSLDGHALPYAFGKPHVKAPQVSTRVVGVVTESQYALSYNNVNSIFEAYLAALPALGQVSLFGLDVTDIDGLQSVQTFFKIIRDLQQLVPSKAGILENFYPMVAWRGTNNSYRGRDDEGRFVYYKNAGLPPPISMYSLLQYNSNDDVHATAEAAYGLNLISGISMTYHNSQTGENNRSLSSIQSYYRGLVNQLLAVPDTIKIDLPDTADGTEVTLKIQGLQVTGVYTSGTLTVSSMAPEVVNWTFGAAAGHHKVTVYGLNGRDVTNKYIKIQVQSDRYASKQYTFVGSVKVLSQEGDVIELDTLPFQSFMGNTTYDTATQTYSFGRDYFSQMIRQGYIFNVSDTLEGSSFSGIQQVYEGNYDWNNTTLVEVPAFYVEAKDGPNDVEDVNEIIHYKEYSTTVGSTSGSSLQTTGGTYTGDTYLTHKAAYAWDFESADFNWSLKAGDTIELDTSYKDVYIADMRPNMIVLGLKAKVGELYVDVPSDLYTVIPEHPIDAILTTAVRLEADLATKALSNDIVIQVDSTQYSVDEILSPLAGVLGKTYNNVVPFPATILPNFAVYGYTDVLDIFKQVTEQSKGAYVLSVDAIKTKYLASVQPVDWVFGLNNMESFNLATADALDLINNTKFTWPSLSFTDKEAIIKLTNQPETLEPNTTKEVTIFEDGVQARDFGRWWVHRQGRDWLEVEIIGFPTELHLDALDVIAFQVEGYDIKGEVLDVTYNHESGEVTLNVVLGDTLWTIGADIE